MVSQVSNLLVSEKFHPLKLIFWQTHSKGHLTVKVMLLRILQLQIVITMLCLPIHRVLFVIWVLKKVRSKGIKDGVQHWFLPTMALLKIVMFQK